MVAALPAKTRRSEVWGFGGVEPMMSFSGQWREFSKGNESLQNGQRASICYLNIQVVEENSIYNLSSKIHLTQNCQAGLFESMSVMPECRGVVIFWGGFRVVGSPPFLRGQPAGELMNMHFFWFVFAFFYGFYQG